MFGTQIRFQSLNCLFVVLLSITTKVALSKSDCCCWNASKDLLVIAGFGVASKCLAPTAPVSLNSALLLCNNPEDSWVTDHVSSSMLFTILGSSVENHFKAGGEPLLFHSH
jgi:hypothetical protein